MFSFYDNRTNRMQSGIQNEPTQPQMYSSFHLKKKLGEGKFAEVFRATPLASDLNDSSLKDVAIKTYKLGLDGQRERRKVLSEIKLEMEPLINCPPHENVIRLLGICEDGQRRSLNGY